MKGIAQSFMEREKSVPTASFGTVFNDPQNHTFDRRCFLEWKHDHAIASQAAMPARLYNGYLNTTANLSVIPEVFSGNPIVASQMSLARSL